MPLSKDARKVFKKDEDFLKEYLMEKAAQGEDGIIDKTQDEMAKETAIARSHISQILNRLRADGVLSMDRGRIQIKDTKKQMFLTIMEIKQKGFGGGNCQVSSTLYNAVLEVPSLEVTERHEHSNDVPYVKDGKDAAVAYGSYDFKFVNNTGNDIKIKASTDNSSVTITINSLKPI